MDKQFFKHETKTAKNHFSEICKIREYFTLNHFFLISRKILLFNQNVYGLFRRSGIETNKNSLFIEI